MRSHEQIEARFTNGEVLRGDLRFSDKPGQFAVVFVHGFGSHRGGEKEQALEAACAQRGWTFAAFDFRGHGQSGGSMRNLRGSRLLEDLAAVYDALAQHGIGRVGLVGSSMGGWASAWFTLANPAHVVGCVLIAPAFRFLHRRWDALTDEQRVQWYETGVLRFRNEWIDVEVGFGLIEERDQFPPERLEAAWARPLLIFHGLADDVVPASDSLEFVQRTTYTDVELRILKSGDHRLNAFKEDIADGACRWFERRF